MDFRESRLESRNLVIVIRLLSFKLTRKPVPTFSLHCFSLSHCDISLSESFHTSSPSPRDENILRKRVWLEGPHATKKAIIFPDEKQITEFGNLIMFVKTISIDE